MTTGHGVARQICSIAGQSRGSIDARVLRVAAERIVQSSNSRRHASTTSSRIPGAARPSRILPRHATPSRHAGPSHVSKKQSPATEVEADNSKTVPAEAQQPQQHPAQQAAEETTSNTITLQKDDDHIDPNKLVIPSTIEDVLGQDTLVVTREIEMMNVFLGFEQANKYAIKNAQGESVGYLAESEKGVLGGSVQRQLLRNHRPFEAQILDTAGNVMMIIRRPFTFINSKISIYNVDSSTKEEVLVGEVHQIFHVIRRKYELFVSKGGEKGNEELEQFADIDEGLWAWDFMLKDDNQRPLGAISRNFRGFGRELFTDTGQYVVTFDPTTLNPDLRIEDGQEKKKDTSLTDTPTGRELITSGPARPLTLQERAVTLATAISADFDYFSRHSQSSTGGFMPYFWMGGGGGGGGGSAEPLPEGGEVGQDSPSTEAGSDVGSQGGGAVGADDGYGGGYPQTEPGPTADSGSAPGDFGQGDEDVWGKDDPWGESAPSNEASSGWGWGNNDSGGGGGGGGDSGGGGGWLDGIFD